MSDEPGSEATAVAKSALSAFDAKRWDEFAGYVHDDALTAFRNQCLAMAHPWDDRAGAQFAGEFAQAAGADAPPVDRTSMSSVVLRSFARVRSLQELTSLSSQDVLARWLEGQEIPPEQFDDHRGPISTRTVLGSVSEGLHRTHVVYRLVTDVGSFGTTEAVNVVTCSDVGGAWRISLNGDFSITGSIHPLQQNFHDRAE